jgi:hypothetical protein
MIDPTKVAWPDTSPTVFGNVVAVPCAERHVKSGHWFGYIGVKRIDLPRIRSFLRFGVGDENPRASETRLFAAQGGEAHCLRIEGADTRSRCDK